jgi:hypothetical protein
MRPRSILGLAVGALLLAGCGSAAAPSATVALTNAGGPIGSTAQTPTAAPTPALTARPTPHSTGPATGSVVLQPDGSIRLGPSGAAGS